MPGQRVVQSNFLGTAPELFKAFETEWAARWKRHENVPSSQWEQIIAFARTSLPHMQCECPKFDVQMLQGGLKRKKKKSATGLDGVSLEDLKHMPCQVLQSHCDLLNVVERKGEWPKQLLEGKVASLAKTETPQSVQEFRPITIFPHLYRIWGSIRSRQLLRALDKVCPAMLLGNRPACHAMQLRTYVQWIVERAHLTGNGLAGISADIQKAFNHLPREVVLSAGVIIGIPMPILQAWTGALTNMHRRFQIRSDLGPPVGSHTGCPEGCSMSCIGMMLVNFLFHNWIEHQYPMARALSYVDDWQVVTTDHHQLLGLNETLKEFTSHVDLLLDPRKTYSWATTTEGRKGLKSHRIIQKHHGKSLGAQMQFTKSHHAAVVHERLAELVPLWKKLQFSFSPYMLKVRVLSRAAWPKGLHGSAATNIGQSAFTSLRSGAMRGINAEGAGCNLWVQLGLIESTEADPQYWVILDTIRSVRMCHSNAAGCGSTATRIPSQSRPHALVNGWDGNFVQGPELVISGVSFPSLNRRFQRSNSGHRERGSLS